LATEVTKAPLPVGKRPFAIELKIAALVFVVGVEGGDTVVGLGGPGGAVVRGAVVGSLLEQITLAPVGIHGMVAGQQ
jgi:hypothetical protein